VLVDCSDPFTIIIQAIINLGESVGSTQADIEAELPNVCPDVMLTSQEVADWITAGLERGIFRWGSRVPTIMVNANMTQVHPGNARYWRCPGIQGSFYRCNRGIN
jgi:hypothetical protein